MIAGATVAEWDWMQFFWKMNTASTDAWSTPELMEVWHDTIAEEGCCHNTTTPPLCSFTTTEAQCDAAPSWTWIQFGETWSDLWATAQEQQSGDPDKRDRFYDEGGIAGIRFGRAHVPSTPAGLSWDLRLRLRLLGILQGV